LRRPRRMSEAEEDKLDETIQDLDRIVEELNEQVMEGEEGIVKAGQGRLITLVRRPTDENGMVRAEYILRSCEEIHEV